MCQVLFWIPLHLIGLTDIPIYGFGAMLFLAFVGGVWLASVLAQRDGVPRERMERLSIWLFVLGILGARILYMVMYVIDSWKQGKDPGTLFEICKKFVAIWDGGLVYYGSFVGGLIGFFIGSRSLVRDFHISRWKLADYFAPSLALGLCIGRIGCLLNGCCYGNVACPHCLGVHFPLSAPPRHDFVARGSQTAAGFTMQQRGMLVVGSVEPHSPAHEAGLRSGDVIIGVNGKKVDNYSDLMLYLVDQWERGRKDLVLKVERGNEEIDLPSFAPMTLDLHPTQVYESISMALLFLVLLAYYPLKHHDGAVLILFMLAYALHRFLNEMLRTDTDKVLFNMTLSQNLSLLMAAAAGVLILLVRRTPPKVETAAVAAG